MARDFVKKVCSAIWQQQGGLQLTTRTRQKDEEVAHFRLAQREYPHLFPSSDDEDLDGERPDIVVRTNSGTYGVEVTSIVDKARRLREEHRRKVCVRAWRLSGLGSGFEVAVLFGPGDVYLHAKSFREQVARRIAEVVQSCVRRQGLGGTWHERIDCYHTPLRGIATAMFVHFIPGWSTTRWYSAEAWSVGELQPQLVDTAIQKKEPLLPAYRQRAEWVALLIVVEGFRGSTSVQIPELTTSFTYRSDFDCVVLFDGIHQTAHRLRIASRTQ